ncbi:MAG: polysaccharide deacetylase family protein [Pseudobdellovibrionaceae bacterium]
MKFAIHDQYMKTFTKSFFYTLVGSLLTMTTSNAQEQSILTKHNVGIVSFTFDDGDYSVLSKAYPLFKKYNFPATAYIPTKYVGQLWTPNINDYNMNESTKNNRYMTWKELHDLENNGWEIGNHSESHPNFEKISDHHAWTEFYHSKKAFFSNRFKSENFATPFGSYNVADLQMAAKFFRSHRGFWERTDLNAIEDRNNLLLNLKAIERSTTSEEIETWIDEAATKGQWLILVFHIIDDNPGLSNEFAYSWPTNDLDKVLKKAKDLSSENKIKVLTVENALKPKGQTIFSDSMDDKSLTDNWKSNPLSNETTSTQTRVGQPQPAVRIDNNNNGAFPKPAKSMSIKGSEHGFNVTSREISISPETSDLEVELYINSFQFKTALLKVLLTEHMSDGSTQKVLLKEMDSNTVPVQRMTIQTHLPTSDIKTVQLEIQSDGPSTGTLYVDEVRIGAMQPGDAEY